MCIGIELTLYVLTQALLSFYRLGAKKYIFPMIKHGEVMLFCLAMGTLMHTYITAPYFMVRCHLFMLWMISCCE